MKVRKICFIIMILGIVLFNTSLKIEAKQPMKLNRKQISMNVGDNFKLKVKHKRKKVKVKWSTSNKKILRVDKSGHIKAIKVGKAKVYAKVGKKVYICKIKINKKEKKQIENKAEENAKKNEENKIKDFSFEKKSINMCIGDKEKIKILVEPNIHTPKVAYELLDEGIVNCDNEGNLEAISKGTARILVQCDGISHILKVNVIDCFKTLDNDKKNETVYVGEQIIKEFYYYGSGNLSLTTSQGTVMCSIQKSDEKCKYKLVINTLAPNYHSIFDYDNNACCIDIKNDKSDECLIYQVLIYGPAEYCLLKSNAPCRLNFTTCLFEKNVPYDIQVLSYEFENRPYENINSSGIKTIRLKITIDLTPTKKIGVSDYVKIKYKLLDSAGTNVESDEIFLKYEYSTSSETLYFDLPYTIETYSLVFYR